MNKQLITEQLENLGLEKTEASLYLFLLEKGSKTYLELARDSKINRSKVYRHIEKLKNKGLVTRTDDSSGKKLKATSPKNLELLIQKKEEALLTQKKTMPELLSVLTELPNHSQKEFEIKHYKGQDGIRQMLWNQMNATNEILAFSYKNKNEMVGKKFAEKLREMQVERKIILKEIENETDQGDTWYTKIHKWKDFYQSKHISKEDLAIKQYIAVYNNTVSIINWINSEQVGIEIHNEIYTNMQKQIFMKTWNSLP